MGNTPDAEEEDVPRDADVLPIPAEEAPPAEDDVPCAEDDGASDEDMAPVADDVAPTDEDGAGDDVPATEEDTSTVEDAEPAEDDAGTDDVAETAGADEPATLELPCSDVVPPLALAVPPDVVPPGPPEQLAPPPPPPGRPVHAAANRPTAATITATPTFRMRMSSLPEHRAGLRGAAALGNRPKRALHHPDTK